MNYNILEELSANKNEQFKANKHIISVNNILFGTHLE